MAGNGQTGNVSLPFVTLHVPFQVILLTEHKSTDQTGESLNLHVYHIDMPLETRLTAEQRLANVARYLLRPGVLLVYVLDVMRNLVPRCLLQSTMGTLKVQNALVAFRVHGQLTLGGELLRTVIANEGHLLWIVRVFVPLEGTVCRVRIATGVADERNLFGHYVVRIMGP